MSTKKKISFIDSLKRITDELPTNNEKNEMILNIQGIIEYFQILKNAINSIPSAEDMEETRHRLDTIQLTLSTHRASKIINSVANFNKSPSQRNFNTFNIEQGRVDLEKLKKMGTDELRATLKDENQYTAGRIRTILEALGVKASSRKIRTELADLVVTKISNYKGYESLRNANEQD